MKTNVMRLLDAAKIKYEVLTYELPFEQFDGVRVSNLLGLDLKMCYKTLALKNNHDLYVRYRDRFKEMC